MIIFKPLSAVKAISFDLDDTLYDNHPIIKQAEQDLLHFIASQCKQAAHVTLQEWRAKRQDCIKQDPRLASDMSELRRVALQQVFMQLSMPTEEATQAANKCCAYFYKQRSAFMVSSSILTTLKTLSSQIPIYAITNGNVDVERIGLAGVFNKVLHASLTRPMKPHRHMFDEVVKLSGVAADNILHVGDNLEKDVMGATLAGYQTAWLACNRPMLLANEELSLLPHIQLDTLAELLVFKN